MNCSECMLLKFLWVKYRVYTTCIFHSKGNTYIFMYSLTFFLDFIINIIFSLFSSPCQRQNELLTSLGVRRPLTFHILIFSSETQAILVSDWPIKKNLLWWNCLAKWTETWWEAPMEGSVLSFLKAEWKVSDTGSAHWASSYYQHLWIYSVGNDRSPTRQRRVEISGGE